MKGMLLRQMLVVDIVMCSKNKREGKWQQESDAARTLTQRLMSDEEIR